jgi:hypothetical protein
VVCGSAAAHCRANKKPPADWHRRLRGPVLRSALGNKYEGQATGHSGSCGGRGFGWHRTGTVKPSAIYRPPTVARPASRPYHARASVSSASRAGRPAFTGDGRGGSGHPKVRYAMPRARARGGEGVSGSGAGWAACWLLAPGAAHLGALRACAGGSGVRLAPARTGASRAVDGELKVLRWRRNLASAARSRPPTQLEGADRCSHSSPTHPPHRP